MYNPTLVLQYVLKQFNTKQIIWKKNKCLLVQSELIYFIVAHVRHSSYCYATSLTCIFGYDLLAGNTGILYTFNTNNSYRFYIGTIYNVSYKIRSVVPLYLCAGWYEREVSEFLGVFFTNSKDTRALLLPFNFKGYPLQKSWGSSNSFTKRTHVSSGVVGY